MRAWSWMRECVSVRENDVGEHERDGSGYCRGEPSPGADVARAGPVPMQMRGIGSPVPVPTWSG
jgi:hypothetical protein